MVAYSFKKRFAAPILAGIKAQTIRGERKRHARPGELLQLFAGMRTKHCRRLGEPRCIAAVPLVLSFGRDGSTGPFIIGDRVMAVCLLDNFARADGFKDVEDMARFWWSQHPPAEGDVITFQGVLIQWEPLTVADPLDIAAVGA